MKKKLYILSAKYLVLLLILFCPVILQAHEGDPDEGSQGSFDLKREILFNREQKEPTVSREEMEMLEKVILISSDDMKSAIELLKNHVNPSSSAPMDYALATLLLQNEQFDKAEHFYRKAIEKFPFFMRAHSGLARVLIQQGRIGEAIKEFENILLSGNPEPSILTMMGYAFLFKEQAVPAETAYRQAILLKPEDVNAWLGLAKSLILQERYFEAKSVIENILEKNPYRKELWFILANIHMALDEVQKAITAIETARSLGLVTPDAMATLGDLYLQSDQAENALLAYKQAFSSDPVNVSRLIHAAESLLLVRKANYAGELIKKMKDLEKEQSICLSDSEKNKLLFIEARMLQVSNDLDKALLAYEALLERDPLNENSLLFAGDIYKEKGDLEKALIRYERAERISETKIHSLIRQAQVEIARDNFRRSVELLEKAQSIKEQPHIARYLEKVRRLVRE